MPSMVEGKPDARRPLGISGWAQCYIYQAEPGQVAQLMQDGRTRNGKPGRGAETYPLGEKFLVVMVLRPLNPD